jgi:hypothetical protein
MSWWSRTNAGRALAVTLAGVVIAAAIVVNLVDAARPECCDGRRPYVTLYAHDRNQVEALLVSGDGQAFAALAQDPLLQRPSVIAADGEYAYRAQRPLWGYLAWAGSAGQADLVGWALVVLAILACGAACGVGALLLLDRGASPWWALGVIAAGYESLGTLTPELFALALFGAGVLLWTRDRRAWAIAAMAAAVLTRETMILGVGAYALWLFAHVDGSFAMRLRRVLPFAVPVAALATWDAVLRLRLGAWPTGTSETRLTLPGVGLVDSLSHQPSPGLVLGALVAIALCVTAFTLARRDPLTWIVLAYGAFATTFSREVWVHAGFTRALLPLYVFGAIVTIAELHRRRVMDQQTTVESGSTRYSAASSLTATS